MRRWRRMAWDSPLALCFVVIIALLCIALSRAPAAEPQQSPWVTNAPLPVVPGGTVEVVTISPEGVLRLLSGITINARTGEVTIPHGMAPSEAAREFWNAVAVVRGAPPPFPASLPNGNATLLKKP